MLDWLTAEDAFLKLAMGCVVALVSIALPWLFFGRLERTSAKFRKLHPVFKIFLGVCFSVCVGYGSFKSDSPTNTTGVSLFSMRPAATFTTVSPADFAIRNWNIVGAWDDSFRCEFTNDFVFPCGTNHLNGVEVLSRGLLWEGPFTPVVVASLGLPVELAPGVSGFNREYIAASETNEAKYVFTWRDGYVNRDPGNRIDGRIELRRGGDILVATNGVERLIPRVLPFEHSGYGQDDEWVAANFTNSVEILETGYPHWIDNQVGEGLTNGFYKLTVTVPERPLETTELSVGDYSVAVTNAGEYVFLLEKGVEYEFGTWPHMDSVSYSWTDDLVNNSFSEVEEISVGDASGVWSEDGGVEVSSPAENSPGVIVWMPRFKAWPDVVHLKPGDFPRPFLAVLSDCRLEASAVHYQWFTGDQNINIVSPTSPETMIEVDALPRWNTFDLSVTARIANRVLCSTLQGSSYGTNEVPTVSCSIAVPSCLILKEKQMTGSVPGSVTVTLISDIPTNGVVRISVDDGGEKITTSLNLPQEYQVSDVTSFSRSFTVDGLLGSATSGDVKLMCEFIDPASKVISAQSSLTVLDPLQVTLPHSPSTGACVVKNTPVSARLDISPSGSFSWGVEWYTAKRRNDGGHDDWARQHVGEILTSISTPDAGVFALKARLVCGTQSNETVYVHAASEAYCAAIKERIGPCEQGEYNHFGVARSEGLLRLRNAALNYLGLAKYGKNMTLESKNEYAAIGERSWKCNRFVADVAIEAGFQVPKNQTYPLFGNVYPPVANDWAKGTGLGDWIHLGSVYPEPGFIAGRYNSQGPGHCGIVDYDGWVISARPDGVGRNAKKMLDGSIKYNVQ